MQTLSLAVGWIRQPLGTSFPNSTAYAQWCLAPGPCATWVAGRLSSRGADHSTCQTKLWVCTWYRQTCQPCICREGRISQTFLFHKNMHTQFVIQYVYVPLLHGIPRKYPVEVRLGQIPTSLASSTRHTLTLRSFPHALLARQVPPPICALGCSCLSAEPGILGPFLQSGKVILDPDSIF